MYPSAKGKVDSAATCRIAAMFNNKGGWSLFEKLQKQHGYHRGTGDPSLAVIMQHLLRQIIGLSLHQRTIQHSGRLVLGFGLSCWRCLSCRNVACAVLDLSMTYYWLCIYTACSAMTQKASLNALLSVKPASYLTVYCAGSQEKLVHRLTVPSMVCCLDMLFQLCLSLKKEDYKFDRGEQPPWWPAVSFKKLSKQVKADMQKLLLTILQLGEDGEALAQVVAGVVH